MKKSERRRIGSLIFLTLAVLAADTVDAISLENYLEQVRGQNKGFQSQVETAEASNLKAREADLFFTPQLFADAQFGEDKKINFESAFQYDKLSMQNYTLGVSQEFRFGLQSKLTYSTSRLEIDGAVGLPPGTPTSLWIATPKVELTLPLWGGGFGRNAEANEILAREQNIAARYGSEAQVQSILVQAEGAYWRLSATQEIVEVQTRAAKNAQSILDYVSRKARMNLGESADVLQARALVESTRFQLQSAENNMKAAQRAFNSYINQEANVAAPKLVSMTFEQVNQIQVPSQRPGDRYDIKAAESQARLAEASATVVSERNRPKLDLYGSHALNGLTDDFTDAQNDAYSNGRNTTFVGVRLNMPLNVGAMSDTKSGALKARRAAQLNLEHQKYLQQLDWENLVLQLGEAKENLRLAENMVKAQKAKLDNEQARLRQGRTTTYQVLLFEQDYSMSEVNRVQASSQIQALNSQIKLYQVQNESGN